MTMCAQFASVLSLVKRKIKNKPTKGIAHETLFFLFSYLYAQWLQISQNHNPINRRF